MIIRTKDFKHKIALSPSRLDTYLECFQKYSYQYIYKGPDTGNSGSSRGSVSHDIFEILSNPRHKKHVKTALKQGTCKTNKPLWRLVESYAKKYNVFNKEDLDLIDIFILTGLSNEFFGPKGTVEVLTEQAFDIEIEGNGISYRIRGFFDKVFLLENEVIVVRDFKSSKAKFEGDKININHQAIIYQLALKYLYPSKKLKDFHFLFLKFPDNPFQMAELKGENFLCGYEDWLTQIQKKIENFSLADEDKNFAADSYLKPMRCGKEGFKKDGSPYFICKCQKPLDFYVLVDEKGEVIKSSFSDNLSPREKEKVEKRHYPGCKFFFKNGERIRN